MILLSLLLVALPCILTSAFRSLHRHKQACGHSCGHSLCAHSHSRRKSHQASDGLNIGDVIFKDSVAESIKSLPSGSTYEYFPPEVGPEIYIGSIVALIPIVWATYEFTSRIRIQQQCQVCRGSGLISLTRNGNNLRNARKCYNCGGFLPWLGWRKFFLSTFDPGNGGVLQRPSKNYMENNLEVTSKSDDADVAEPQNEE